MILNTFLIWCGKKSSMKLPSGSALLKLSKSQFPRPLPLFFPILNHGAWLMAPINFLMIVIGISCECMQLGTFKYLHI